jgi:hypothetical protein
MGIFWMNLRIFLKFEISGFEKFEIFGFGNVLRFSRQKVRALFSKFSLFIFKFQNW